MTKISTWGYVKVGDSKANILGDMGGLEAHHDFKDIVESSPTATLFMVHTALPGDKYVCPRCGSSHVDIYTEKKQKIQACLDCGHEDKLKE